LCWGLIVVSLGFGRSFTGGLRSLAAGEVTEFTEAVDEARRGALFRMVEHAKALGGNAVVGVTFDSNSLGEGGALGHEDVQAAAIYPWFGPRERRPVWVKAGAASGGERVSGHGQPSWRG
jgi:uncharacterized protein YbjQ (UPF0145 family)